MRLLSGGPISKTCVSLRFQSLFEICLPNLRVSSLSLPHRKWRPCR
jgi:hypothetical protein